MAAKVLRGGKGSRIIEGPKDLGAAGRRKFRRVMAEFGEGKLRHGGSGEIVSDVKTAQAIAFSEAREADRGARKRAA